MGTKKVLTESCSVIWHLFSLSSPFSEAYLKPSQTSKKELFAKIINSWKPLTTFAKSTILDGPLGSEYASTI